MYRAKHGYDPKRPDEMLLDVGDVVTDMKDVGNGWVVGHNQTTGKTGLCPRDYLQDRFSRKSRISRMKNRMSTIYVNLTSNPKPVSDVTFTHFTVTSPETEDKPKTKPRILPQTQTRYQKCTRAITGILVGFLLGAIIFAALSLSYGYSFIASASIAGVLTLVMCLFLIISPHARCVSALMSVSVFTGQGRAAFLSFVPGLLFAGPVMNMQRNINEAGTSAACIAEVLLNQSLAIHQQLLEPVAKQQRNLEVAAKYIEKKSVEIHSTFESFRSMLEDVNVSSSALSSTTFEKECTRHLTSMYNQCVREVADNIQTCKNYYKNKKYRDPSPTQAIPGHSRTKRFSFGRKKCSVSGCNTANPEETCRFLNASNICQFNQVLTANITTVTQNFNDIDNLISFSLNSSGLIDVRGNTSIDPIKQLRKLKANLQHNVDVAVNVFRILNKILIMFLICAVLNACIYLRKYLRKVKYDNIYISDQFKYLDKNLRQDEEKAVLPLKAVETKRYIDPTSPKLCPAEAVKCKLGLTMVILHIVLAAIVILIDVALYYVLKVIAENGDIDFLVTGGVWLRASVGGSGPFADIFRAVVEGVSVSKEFEDVLNFKQCLPTASEPNLNSVYSVSVLYFMVVVFVLFQAYGLRLRHTIIAFFFPEREAQRIHYLYRHILLMRRVREEEENKINLLTEKWEVFGNKPKENTSKC